MKFKTKEEILKNIERMPKSNYKEGYIDGINGAFKSFAERIVFYKKYEDRIEAFHDIHGGELNKEDLKEVSSCLEWECFEAFNKWLFNYCFGDIQ